AATPSVAMNILPPAVLQFTQRFPGVQLDIRDMDSVAITNELTRGRADIGIGTLPEIAGLRRTELFSDPFGVVCRKDHPLARDWDQLRWRDMQDYVMIANGLSHMITDPDFEPILAKSHLMVPSVVSLLGLVREGVGISVLPRLAALHAPDEIAFLPLRDAAARRHVHIVSQPHARQMPAARAFAELMTGLVRDGALASTL
ncbi:MAG: LysR substrate-binding domain-containing protein, partial [Pseudomonadota bacterium]